MAKKPDEQLTTTSFKQLWQKELLPSIKKEIRIEIKVEVDQIKSSINDLTDRYAQIEQSQKFISQKFDELVGSMQQTKKHIQTLECKIKEQDNFIKELKGEASSRDEELDEIQQYSRRDCIEIVGIPHLPRDNPRNIFKELCSSIDVDLEDHEISTVHRLPDTKKVKNRMIAKLVHRDTRERIYQSKKKLVGKNTRILPSVNAELGKSLPNNQTKIFINESLTSTRKKIFSKAYKFKKNNDFKHLWTSNGKILQKENDSSPVHSFTTLSDFDDFEMSRYQ